MKALSNLLTVTLILVATIGSMGLVLSTCSGSQTAIYQVIK